MKMVGAGAIGGHLGARPARSGQQVTLIACNRNLAAINSNGLRLVFDDGSEEHAPTARAVQSMAEAGERDIVLIALKAHQLREVLPEPRALFGEQTIVVTMINGIPWWYFHRLRGGYEGRSLASVDPDGLIASTIEPGRLIGRASSIRPPNGSRRGWSASSRATASASANSTAAAASASKRWRG
jgi:2-dehydropantoate 2-reductase